MGWRCFPPRGSCMPAKALADFDVPGESWFYAPTRKGARKANLFEFAVITQSPRRIVAKDRVGPVEVSTIFLGMDDSFGSGDPVLWETMIFHSGSTTTCDEKVFLDMGCELYEVTYLGQEQWHYTSRKEATSHHAALVDMLRSGPTLRR